jgi:predicted nucleotidyltransferase
MNEIVFNSSVSPEMQETIVANLKTLEARECVQILFAIESGSRAWGFPSPDSDYDARFVYARPTDWYLSITPGRDVIELPIEDLLDINGWDIKKALGLLLKPNPVLLEWLSSPLRYLWNDEVCERLIDFSSRITHGPACLHHYLHLGGRQWNVYIEGKERVNLKKYFYIVRPAMVVRWIRLNPETIPPMNLQDLVAGINLPSGLVTELEKLLIQKSRSKEVGEAPRIPAIDDFITSEFTWAREAVNELRSDRQDMKVEADALFRAIVKDADAQRMKQSQP